MLKHSAIAATLLLVCGVSAANTAIDTVNNQVSVSIDRQRMDYHEYDKYHRRPDGGYADSETGSQPSVTVAYAKQFNTKSVDNIYLKGSLGYAHGNTHYDGYLQDSNGNFVMPYQATTSTTTLDFSLKAGKGFAVGRDAQVTPYVGYAYHRWVRDSTDDPYGSKETYSHHAVSVGILGQYVFTPKFVGHIDANIGRTTHAKMKYYGEPYDYNLGAKSASTMEFGLTYLVDKNWSIAGGYRLSKFRYGESPVVPSGYYEPESKTKLQTIYLGVGYHF